MRSKILGIILLSALIAGCKKEKPAKPAATTAEISVQLQNGNTLSNVTIKLLSDQHKTSLDYLAKGTSNSSGIVDFDITAGTTYYLYYDGPNDKILYPEAYIRYITIGTFASQQQIDSSPFQSSTTKVGDPIYQDINGDGVIDAGDQVMPIVPGVAGIPNKFSLIMLTAAG